MPHSSQHLVSVALTAVECASAVCRRVQRGLERLRAITKDDKSPVTIADFASQAVVAHTLSERLGKVRLVAEESSAFLRDPAHHLHLKAAHEAATEAIPGLTASRLLELVDLGACDPLSAPGEPFWTLDPIDGTKGFLRGGQYCVSLALIQDGVPILGVLGCPNLSSNPAVPVDPPSETGSMFWAVRDGGSKSGPMPGVANAAAVSAKLWNTERPVVLAESVEAAHSDHSASSRVLQAAGVPHTSIRLDSQCKYAVVARGQADAYLRLPTKPGYVERIWDHAAGSLVASEAGCIVTDIAGKPLDFSHGRGLERNLGIVVASTPLHARLIRAIREAGLTG